MLFSVALSIVVGSPCLQFAYVKNGGIYTSALESGGQMHPAKFVAKMLKGNSWLHWTPSGSVAVGELVFDRKANNRLRPENASDNIWKCGGQGKITLEKGTLYQYRDAKKRILLADVISVKASANGRQFLALRRRNATYGEEELVGFDPFSDRVWFREPISNGILDGVSNDGTLYAYMSHLSRPLTGSHLSKFRGETVRLPQTAGFAPTVVEDICPFSNHLMLEFRTPDPKNDGSWLDGHLVEWSPDESNWREFGRGNLARYLFGGRNVAIFRPNQGAFGSGKLLIKDRETGKETMKLAGVSDVVFRDSFSTIDKT